MSLLHFPLSPACRKTTRRKGCPSLTVTWGTVWIKADQGHATKVLTKQVCERRLKPTVPGWPPKCVKQSNVPAERSVGGLLRAKCPRWRQLRTRAWEYKYIQDTSR